MLHTQNTEVSLFDFKWKAFVLNEEPFYDLITLASNFQLAPAALADFMSYLSGYLTVKKHLLEALTDPVIIKHNNKEISVIRCEDVMELLRTFSTAKKNGTLYASEMSYAAKSEAVLPKISQNYLKSLAEAISGYTLLKQNLKQGLSRKLISETSRRIYQWTETFPDDFFARLFTLFPFQWNDLYARADEVGSVLINIVYSRLPEDTYEEMLSTNPKKTYSKNGIPGSKLPSRRLHEHLVTVSSIIALSGSSQEIFFQLLNRVAPVRHQYLVMPLKKKKQELPKELLPVLDILKTSFN